jgi:chemotaxis protein MotB
MITRRQPPPARTSRDRWLVAYADMLTLLFAVFVSLYAARIDFLPPAAAADGRIDGGQNPVAGTADGDDALWRQVQDVIAGTPRLQLLEVRREARGIVISMPEAGSFLPGRSELSVDAQAVMRGLADVIRRTAAPVRVEGHTDDVPIHNASFASNWELSTARATEVVQLLTGAGGVPAGQLSAAGYGEFRPRLPNVSSAARARNRRVDLIILNGGAPGGGR